MDWLKDIGPILSGSGLSFGGVFILFVTMFARGYVWTKPQVDTVKTNLEAELSRSNTDRDYWRDAFFDEKGRADAATDTLQHVVPLLGGNLKALDALTRIAEGGTADGPG
jgi:hypothetical protein